MTRGPDGRPGSGSGWLALLALPVLCCTGHLLLVGLGAGSLAAVVGGVALQVPAAVWAAGLLLLLAGAVAAAGAARRRRGSRRT